MWETNITNQENYFLHKHAENNLGHEILNEFYLLLLCIIFIQLLLICPLPDIKEANFHVGWGKQDQAGRK